jgi:hypothetical protein
MILAVHHHLHEALGERGTAAGYPGHVDGAVQIVRLELRDEGAFRLVRLPLDLFESGKGRRDLQFFLHIEGAAGAEREEGALDHYDVVQSPAELLVVPGVGMGPHCIEESSVGPGLVLEEFIQHGKHGHILSFH